MQDKNTLDQLKNIINEREEKVKQLDKELRNLKEMKSNDEQFFIHATKPQTPPSPVSFNNSLINNNIDHLDSTRNRPSSSNKLDFMRNRSDSINERDIGDRNISSRFFGLFCNYSSINLN
jgi:hypothetical protein